jgi:hypothetical protein
LEDSWVGRRLLDNLIPRRIGDIHEIGQKPLLLMLVALGSNHISARFIESVDLLRRQVTCNFAHVPDNFLDERLLLTRLKSNEMSTALTGNLDESITGHVLDTYSLD